MFEFAHDTLVLPCAVARLRVRVEGSIVDVVHPFGFKAAEAAPLNRGNDFLVLRDVGFAHGYVATWEELVELLLSLFATAVLDHGVDQLINPRRLGQLRDLVAQSFGVLF